MKNKALKRYIYSLSPLLFLLLLCSYKTDAPVKKTKKDTVNASFKMRTLIIDAGHGGHTGAAGSYSTEEGVTLALAFKLQKAVEKNIPGLNVVMTRTTPAGVSLQKRSDIANNSKGDLFISLHCNSLSDRTSYSHGKKIRVPDKSGRGVLVLVYGFHRDKEETAALRENLFEEQAGGKGIAQAFDPNDPVALIQLNAFKAKYRKNSIRFANLVNGEFVDTDGRHSDGVKEQGILVLCHSAMPAVLIETGFINNPTDEEYLNSEAGQNEIVASIVRALIEYKKEVE
ncbi:MAG: N-acetylmuramoyl-L-alanine amidase [Mucilaginibacter sp.]|uniref:N-acetylmuramoyl-L-alanine amidase family protein n=1 Tax=Mucilaginibacter sp. TaxID=1882438 RepID=UPI003263681E